VSFLNIVPLYFHGVVFLPSRLNSKLPYILIRRHPLAGDQLLANFTSPFSFSGRGSDQISPWYCCYNNSVLPAQVDESMIINRLWRGNLEGTPQGHGKMQSQRHPVHQKSQIGCPGFEPGLCGENRVKNSLRQGTRTFALQPADVPTWQTK
jgi:hypothetical protein